MPLTLSERLGVPHRRDYARLMKDLTRNMLDLSNKVKQIDKYFKRTELTTDILTNTSGDSRTFSNVFTSEQDSLLTLFTTLEWTADKEHIYNITYMNWASLKPVVNPVLFTNDPRAASVAMTFGLEVQNTTGRSNSGLPVLKNMYLSAMRSYRSYFYCFANSDILFDGGLVKTLVNIQFHNISSTFKHVLITGKRHNVVNVSKSEVRQRQDIETLVKSRGELFITSAEDYFITDRFYPWESIPEVVIASLAYDNWLIMNAREKRHLVIDATKTINALHQSIDNNYHRSHGRDYANFNVNLLKEWSKINIPYHKGFVHCIERFTDIVKDVFVINERMVDASCN
ncbi:hypothetical protein ACF0H5_006868 [Mactra antiquata]